MTDLRALTVWQPYASLCVTPDPVDPSRPIKPVENRGWPPPSTLPQWYRRGPRRMRLSEGQAEEMRESGVPVGEPDGPLPSRLGIHAGQSVDEQAMRDLPRRHHGITFRLRALLGFVTVTGCHHADQCRHVRRWTDGFGSHQRTEWCSPWAQPDQYHWTLADPEPLAEPIPMRGRQGLWRLPDDAAAQLTNTEGATV